MPLDYEFFSSTVFINRLSSIQRNTTNNYTIKAKKKKKTLINLPQSATWTSQDNQTSTWE